VPKPGAVRWILPQAFGFSWQFTLNLLGAPALDKEKFEEYEQRTVISFLLGNAVPVGTYLAARKINLGEYRWSFRVGLPFVQSIGPWIPGKITIIEITPSVFFASPNDDFQGDHRLTQNPIWLLEAHLTRDITEMFFAALDYSLNFEGRRLWTARSRKIPRNHSF
jgi:hypothetical protein